LHPSYDVPAPNLLAIAPRAYSHTPDVAEQVFLALPEEQLPFVDESQRKRSSTFGISTTSGEPEAGGGGPEDETRVSVRFALQLPPPLLNAWLRRQRRVTVDFRELQYADGPTALVALTGASNHAPKIDVGYMKR
jgi:hypothetical protein